MTTVGGSSDPISSSSAEQMDLAPTTVSSGMSMPAATTCPPSEDVGPVTKKTKTRPTPYAKPILLTNDRKSRKRKSISWLPDEKILSVRYFELIKDERENVYNKKLEANQQLDTLNNPSPTRMLNPAAVDGLYKKPSGKNEPVEYRSWRPLILIDLKPTLPSPGWNSKERTAQAEREIYVLGAIDLPGKPSTLDEPDSAPTDSKDVQIIPLDDPDGIYTEYEDMYNCEVINGVRQPTYMTPFFDAQQLVGFCTWFPAMNN